MIYKTWIGMSGIAMMLLSACTLEQPQFDQSPPIDVSFTKLTQPAFFGEYGGRNVRFSVTYGGPYAFSADLPDYSKYFRFMACSPGPGCPNRYAYLFAPAAMADRLSEMKEGELIKLTARAEPTMLYGRQPELLLVVTDIDVLESKSKSKKPK